MPQPWHDINDPGFLVRKKKDEPAGQPVTDDESPAATTEEEPEVRLISAEWKPGPKGFRHNEQCFLDVKAEYLKDTIRARIRGKLFGVYGNREEDLAHEVEGFIDKKTGVARMDIRHLFFVSDEHYNTWIKNKKTPSAYLIKGLFHSKGQNRIDSPKLEMPQIQKCTVAVVEVLDTLFHSNSAIPSLDPDGELVSSAITAYNHAQANTGQELVVCGHADKSGEYDYNYTLSELRAKATRAVLDNDAQVWADIAKQRSKVEDYQTILKTLTTTHGWNCDPGKIDNEDGPKTRGGVEAFQKQYNSAYGESIGVDGDIGPLTWKAIHRVVVDLIHTAYEKSEGTGEPPALPYRSKDKGIYACGESFPITKGHSSEYRSTTGRRVELVFYDKDDPPTLEKPANTNEPIPESLCDIYDPELTTYTMVAPGDAGPKRDVALALEYPASSPYKHYVNAPDNGKDQGTEMKIVVTAQGADDGDAVKWNVTAGKENSKRNAPVPYLKDPAGGSETKLGDGAAVVTTKVSGGKAEVLFNGGVAGGDTFAFKIRCGTGSAELTVTVWRRFWYQLTHEKGLALPGLKVSTDAFEKVFAEMTKADTREFVQGDLGALSAKNVNTYYKEWVISPGGSDSEAAVIGSHNKNFFYKYYTNDAARSPQVHLMICRHQWDEGRSATGSETRVLKSKTSGEVNVKSAVFKPHLKGNLVKSGTWQSQAPAGHKDHGKSGNITDEWIVVEKNRTSRTHVKLQVPDSVGITPDASVPVKATFKLNTVDGPYLGESNGHQILAVYDPNDKTDFCNTLTHEIAHTFNQVPESGKLPPGLTAHPRQYTGHGGTGSHCNTVLDGAGKQAAGSLNPSNEYGTGVCVMFHAGDSSCIDEFCDTCVPYVKATDMSGFGKK